MSRGRYIPWTSEEEKRLPAWLSRLQHLPWWKISQEYFREFGIPRTIHSLRGKLDQLQKGHERQRPISQRASEFHHSAARRARRRERRLMAIFPVSPPPLILKKSDPRFRRLLQQMQQLDICREDVSADTPTVEENHLSPLPQARSKPGAPRIYEYQFADTPLTALLIKQGTPKPTSGPATRPTRRKVSGRFTIISLEEPTGQGEERIAGARRCTI